MFCSNAVDVATRKTSLAYSAAFQRMGDSVLDPIHVVFVIEDRQPSASPCSVARSAAARSDRSEGQE
jgi:hypothetical protein